MNIRFGLACLAFLFTSSAALSGCASSPEVSFYTLEPIAKTDTTVPPLPALSISIGPVTMPDFVDRPQLVRRAEGARVLILESQRWAEPLKNAVPRLLAENLSLLLGTNRISAYPRGVSEEADCRVLLDFRRFEAAEDSVNIDALYTIRALGDELSKTGKLHISEPIAGQDYEALVSAYNRALSALSKDLARVISEGRLKGH